MIQDNLSETQDSPSKDIEKSEIKKKEKDSKD